MQTWEHKVATFSGPAKAEMSARLSSLGAEGWEAVGMVFEPRSGPEDEALVVLLKRPVEAGRPAGQAYGVDAG